MKIKFSKYWLIVSFFIVLNIFIFVILSNKLESFVYENTINKIMPS
jgi:hypothetical protein